MVRNISVDKLLALDRGDPVVVVLGALADDVVEVGHERAAPDLDGVRVVVAQEDAAAVRAANTAATAVTLGRAAPASQPAQVAEALGALGDPVADSVAYGVAGDLDIVSKQVRSLDNRGKREKREKRDGSWDGTEKTYTIALGEVGALLGNTGFLIGQSHVGHIGVVVGVDLDQLLVDLLGGTGEVDVLAASEGRAPEGDADGVRCINIRSIRTAKGGTGNGLS